MRIYACIVAGNGIAATREGGLSSFCKGWLYAYRKPADPQASPGTGKAQQGSCSSGKPAEAWCLHPRLHDDPEEAELGSA
jgi:hypothetical protein